MLYSTSHYSSLHIKVLAVLLVTPFPRLISHKELQKDSLCDSSIVDVAQQPRLATRFHCRLLLATHGLVATAASRRDRGLRLVTAVAVGGAKHRHSWEPLAAGVALWRPGGGAHGAVQWLRLAIERRPTVCVEYEIGMQALGVPTARMVRTQ